MWELIISSIVALTSLIGAVWGIVRYYDQKRANKAKEDHAEIVALRTALEAMADRLENMEMRMMNNELDRLRSDIINFETQLRNGFAMSEGDFSHIHHSYDKYHAAHGNSYIDGVMADIIEMEHEYRAAIMGEDNE